MATLLKYKFCKPVLVLCVPLFFVALVSPVSVHAQSKEQVCAGLNMNYDAGSNDCVPRGGGANVDTRVEDIIEAALNILSIVVGIAAVVMIIMAGFRYITAGGDANKVSNAQMTIIWAVVGLVVAAVAQVLVRFVLSRVPT